MAPQGPPPNPIVTVFPDHILEQTLEKRGVTININVHGWNWALYTAQEEEKYHLVDTGAGYKTRLEAEDAGFRRAMQLKGE